MRKPGTMPTRSRPNNGTTTPAVTRTISRSLVQPSSNIASSTGAKLARKGRGGRAMKPASRPIAASIAASAASALAPSGPPACAMSGRPPPPLPPSASAPIRTRSTALKRAVRSSVTPTTMPALPSSATRDDRDDAGADRLLALVDEALEVLGATPVDRAAEELDRRRPRGCRYRRRPLRRRPWRASCAPRRVRARACGARRPAPRRARPLLRPHLERERDGAAAASPARRDACAPPRRSAPRCGARPPPRRFRRRSRPGRSRRCGRHACRRRARPNRPCPGTPSGRRAHRHDAHLVAIFLAEQRHRARIDRLVAVHQARRRPARPGARPRWRAPRPPRFLVRVDRLRMREVEAEAIGRDQRALLRDMACRARCGAPRGGDASPNGWRGSSCAARGRSSSRTASPTETVPLSTLP